VQVTPLAIADVCLIAPKRFQDARGYFCETYQRDTFAAAGITVDFVQDNESLSVSTGTVRGLHYQAPPFTQAKLVRVLAGAVFDVAVDIRTGSPTFGKFVTATLSAENGEQLFIPEGFAHGFCSLADNTVLAYKVSAPYSKEHDFGVSWNDPDLAIPWPVPDADAVLSDKDAALPRLTDISSPFDYVSGP
jgi:dTDP-4-dehydrorhamnose 3,5-epimerase